MNKILSKHSVSNNETFKHLKTALFLFSLLVFNCIFYGLEKQTTQSFEIWSDELLLEQFIKSKGSTISFDSSNIKQFWTDSSVLSTDNIIKILINQLNKNNFFFESVPLKIQLANVNETMNCRIDVFSNNVLTNFYVLDDKQKTISSSHNEDHFLDYFITSSIFHLEDTFNDTFFLKFYSTSQNDISIKKIVLSFSNNDSSIYLVSPGKLIFSKTGFDTTATTSLLDNDFVSVTGKTSIVLYSKRILIADNTLHSSLTVKILGMLTLLFVSGLFLIRKKI